MRAKFNQMCVREAMITLAGKPGYGEQPRWLEKVANAANISTRAARDLWQGDISDHNHRAAIAVRKAVELKQYRAEAKALALQYQTIIGGMRATDAPFFSEEITRLERIVRELGDVDSPGTAGRAR